MKYSGFSLVKNALRGNRHWPNIAADIEPKSHYDIVIIGAGGHGLATAHYLARNHGINDVLVIDSGWIGGGNTGRNTTIVRSDYLLSASFQLKDFALHLWKELSQELNFNLMYSPRGYIDLAHSDGELEHFMSRANAMRLGGANAEILSPQELAERVPGLEISDNTRFPISGALFQPEGGVVRHDAVAWGFARSASSAGIHILQNCPVTGLSSKNNRITSISTPRGDIECDRVLIAAASASSKLAAMVDIKLPLDPVNVQAFVSEPVKPILDSVINYNAGLAYLSQTDKGELVLGGATDGYASLARRGSFSSIEDTLARAVQMFPFISQLRLMRHWSGTADIPMDGNAIVGRSPIENLYLNCGWGYAGFKATPAVGWTMAELLATNKIPRLLQPFALDRFESGALIDDAGIGPYPWLH
ncbi:MAG: heterotetrameric sarcosine oxidase beta subunit [Planctomycetota bacterium]|jgi:heterotetrameric sarcosine oxidase beta subunit